MKKVLILIILLITIPAVACDCKPDGGMSALSNEMIQRAIDRAAERADYAKACERARLLGDLQNATSLYDVEYSTVKAQYEYWSDRCEQLISEKWSIE